MSGKDLRNLDLSHKRDEELTPEEWREVRRRYRALQRAAQGKPLTAAEPTKSKQIEKWDPTRHSRRPT